MDVAPPSYALSTALPSYTEAAAGPSYSISPPSSSQQTTAHEEYVYKSGGLSLNLGPKRCGLVQASYGWNDTVEGTVTIKKNTKGVQSVTVHIEGEITTGVSERGFLVEQTKKKILHMSQILFQVSPGEEFPAGGAQYRFSFPLPTYVTGGREHLPPTCSLTHAGMAGNVTYSVRVEMLRKGKLRANERFVISI